jgi:hypothetical protein
MYGQGYGFGDYMAYSAGQAQAAADAQKRNASVPSGIGNTYTTHTTQTSFTGGGYRGESYGGTGLGVFDFVGSIFGAIFSLIWDMIWGLVKIALFIAAIVIFVSAISGDNTTNNAPSRVGSGYPTHVSTQNLRGGPAGGCAALEDSSHPCR